MVGLILIGESRDRLSQIHQDATMTRHPSRCRPQVDCLETKLALATVAAAATDTILTPGEYAAARANLQVAVNRLASTGSEARAEADLARATRLVPGGASLLPTLRADLAAADRSIRGSIPAARVQLAADLDAFIRDRVAAGAIDVAGRALRARFPSPPAPLPTNPTAPTNPGTPTTPLPSTPGYSNYFQVQNLTPYNLNFVLTQGNINLGSTTIYSQRSPNLNYTTQTTAPVIASLSNANTGTFYFSFPMPTNLARIRIVPNSSGGIYVYTYTN